MSYMKHAPNNWQGIDSDLLDLIDAMESRGFVIDKLTATQLRLISSRLLRGVDNRTAGEKSLDDMLDLVKSVRKDPVSAPIPPLNRHISDRHWMDRGVCPKCNSTTRKEGLFSSIVKCIHPSCGYTGKL